MIANALILTCIIGFVTNVMAKQNHYTTPVPILKQINRQNKDGSYSYGYEAADQSYKIETKYPNGEVYGKYGYVDDRGMLREIEYGASKRGFEPQGIDINVPPPTEPQTNENILSPLGPNDIDDGQYREDPRIYYDFINKTNGNSYTKQSRRNELLQPSTFIQPKIQNLRQRQNKNNASLQKNEYSSEPQQRYNQPPQQVINFDGNKYYQSPQQQQQHTPLFQEKAHPQQEDRVQTYQQSNQQPNYYNNNNNNKYYQSSNYQNIFSGHPATNIDINTGSYSLTYVG